MELKRSAGGYQVRVRWLGFSELDDTWEPVEVMAADLSAMFKEFVRKYADVQLAFEVE